MRWWWGRPCEKQMRWMPSFAFSIIGPIDFWTPRTCCHRGFRLAMSSYMSIVVTLVPGWVFKKKIKKGEDAKFHSELKGEKKWTGVRLHVNSGGNIILIIKFGLFKCLLCKTCHIEQNFWLGAEALFSTGGIQFHIHTQCGRNIAF